MSNESESVRFHQRMSETLDSLLGSLTNTIVSSVNRGKAYFRPAIQKLLYVSPAVVSRYAQSIRDRKVSYRQFFLIRQKLRKMKPETMTPLEVHEIRLKVAEAWSRLEEIEKQDAEIQDGLKFIEKHVQGVKNFLQHMSDELMAEDEIFDEEYCADCDDYDDDNFWDPVNDPF